MLTRGVQYSHFVSIKMLLGIHPDWLVFEIKGCHPLEQTFLMILTQENRPEGRENKNYEGKDEKMDPGGGVACLWGRWDDVSTRK